MLVSTKLKSKFDCQNNRWKIGSGFIINFWKEKIKKPDWKKIIVRMF